MVTTKPDLTRIWAANAPPANVVDPDVTSPGKFNAGWQAEVPPFEHFNFLQQLFTQSSVYNNEQGVNEWDTNTTYPIDALVKGSDGNLYQALSEQSGNDPTSSPTIWTRSIKGIVAGDPDGRYRILACAIRNTGAGWAFINDSQHEPIGFTGISTLLDGRIQLDHEVEAEEVGCLLVTPDETFSTLGIIAGGSIGLDLSLINIGAPLEFLVNTANGAINAPSYWGSKISTVVTSGVCEVDHPACAVGGVPSIAKAGISSPYHTDVLVSYSQTDTDLYAAGDVDGYIYYDGANWQYLGELLNAPSISWNGVTNELEVIHETCDSTNISISPRGSGARAQPDSIGPASFQVRFFDAAGNQLTTEATNMQFFFTRKSTVRKTLLGGQYTVRRGYAQVDANDLVSGSGNFWIIGLQKVG